MQCLVSLHQRRVVALSPPPRSGSSSVRRLRRLRANSGLRLRLRLPLQVQVHDSTRINFFLDMIKTASASGRSVGPRSYYYPPAAARADSRRHVPNPNQNSRIIHRGLFPGLPRKRPGAWACGSGSGFRNLIPEGCFLLESAVLYCLSSFCKQSDLENVLFPYRSLWRVLSYRSL